MQTYVHKIEGIFRSRIFKGFWEDSGFLWGLLCCLNAALACSILFWFTVGSCGLSATTYGEYSDFSRGFEENWSLWSLRVDVVVTLERLGLHLWHGNLIESFSSISISELVASSIKLSIRTISSPFSLFDAALFIFVYTLLALFFSLFWIVSNSSFFSSSVFIA